MPGVLAVLLCAQRGRAPQTCTSFSLLIRARRMTMHFFICLLSVACCQSTMNHSIDRSVNPSINQPDALGWRCSNYYCFAKSSELAGGTRARLIGAANDKEERCDEKIDANEAATTLEKHRAVKIQNGGFRADAQSSSTSSYMSTRIYASTIE